MRTPNPPMSHPGIAPGSLPGASGTPSGPGSSRAVAEAAAHKHGGERFPVRAQVFVGPMKAGVITEGASGERGFGPTAWQVGAYLGATIDLSLEGLLLRAARPLELGERVPLRLLLPGRTTEVSALGRVVRVDAQTYAPDHAVALHFDQLSDEARQQISDLFTAAAAGRGFHYRVERYVGEPGQPVAQEGRLVISLSGVLNAGVDLTPLKQLRGELDFKLRDFRRISSDSIQSWLDLVRSLTGASRIRLCECPIAFIQQANAISNLLDNTEVVSFFAPYLCPACRRDEEVLLDVRRDLVDDRGQLMRRPPPRSCPECNGALVFDDIPERYFMFL